MRWILVFLFLFLIPLIVLFKNYNNKKRSFLYGSTYVILVTTIVITNVYISGLNKIKEALYYENYSFENEYRMDDLYETNKDISYESKSKENIEKDVVVANNNENSNKNINTSNIKKEDKELIYKFKQEVYEIELKALIPMRECLPYTKNIAENLKKLDEVKKDLENASYMCREVISLYKTMNIPQLSDDRYTEIIDDARNDVKMAYELREKAMESAITLITTKNPKYIGKITEYLSLSDNCISNFKDRLTDLNKIIDKQ